MQKTSKQIPSVCTLLTITLISILFCACHTNDEGTRPDTTAPSVGLNGVTDNETVWNSLSLSLSASDDNGLEKVEIFVDGLLIKTFTREPFDFPWDTQTVDDGDHTLKVVATDKGGNQSTKEVTVVVHNVLLSSDIGTDHLLLIDNGESSYQQRGFVFLSDANGKVIIAQEFHNGDQIRLKAAAFNGDEFYVTEVHTDTDDSDIYLTTFRGVKRGKWNFSSGTNQEKDPTFAGGAKLNFTNATANADYRLTTNGDNGYAYPNNLSPTINIKQDPSKLVIVKKLPGAPLKYAVIPSISVGNNISFNLQNVSKTLNTVTIDVPSGYTDGHIWITGLRNANNFSETYDLGLFESDENSELMLYDFGTEFPGYIFDTFFENGVTEAFGNSSNTAYDITPLDCSLDFTIEPTRFTGTASGTMDFQQVSVTHSSEDYAYWVFIGSKGTDISFVIPEVPAILTPLITNDFADQRIEVYAIDYGNIDGYEGLKNFIASSSTGLAGMDTPELTGKAYFKIIQNSPGKREGKGTFNFHNVYGFRKRNRY